MKGESFTVLISTLRFFAFVPRGVSTSARDLSRLVNPFFFADITSLGQNFRAVRKLQNSHAHSKCNRHVFVIPFFVEKKLQWNSSSAVELNSKKKV